MARVQAQFHQKKQKLWWNYEQFILSRSPPIEGVRNTPPLRHLWSTYAPHLPLELFHSRDHQTPVMTVEISHDFVANKRLHGSTVNPNTDDFVNKLRSKNSNRQKEIVDQYLSKFETHDEGEVEARKASCQDLVNNYYDLGNVSTKFVNGVYYGEQ